MNSTYLAKAGTDSKRIGYILRYVMTSGFSPPPLVALVQDLIHCRMYILVTTFGLLACSTTKQEADATGLPIYLIVIIVLTYTWKIRV